MIIAIVALLTLFVTIYSIYITQKNTLKIAEQSIKSAQKISNETQLNISRREWMAQLRTEISNYLAILSVSQNIPSPPRPSKPSNFIATREEKLRMNELKVGMETVYNEDRRKFSIQMTEASKELHSSLYRIKLLINSADEEFKLLDRELMLLSGDQNKAKGSQGYTIYLTKYILKCEWPKIKGISDNNLKLLSKKEYFEMIKK